MLVNGINCYITVDGKRVREFSEKRVGSNDKTCYIEARDGKKFEIELCTELYPAKTDFTFVAWVDGIPIEWQAFQGPKESFTHASVVLAEDPTTGRTDYGQKHMYFGALRTDRGDKALNDLNIPRQYLDNLGTIKVQIALDLPGIADDFEEDWLCRADIPRKPGVPLKGDRNQANHYNTPDYETASIEGRDITHRTRFVECENLPIVHYEHEGYAGKGPDSGHFQFHVPRARLPYGARDTRR